MSETKAPYAVDIQDKPAHQILTELAEQLELGNVELRREIVELQHVISIWNQQWVRFTWALEAIHGETPLELIERFNSLNSDAK